MPEPVEATPLPPTPLPGRTGQLAGLVRPPLLRPLTKCIRTNADCADVCDTTGRVLSRHSGYDANLTRAVLEACAAACKACGDECESHASMHEHCRICAEACRRCETACRELIGSLG